MADAKDHTTCGGPDECFGCKMRYWREGGGAPLRFTYGKKAFHGPTQRELADRERSTFRERNGYDPVPVSARAELV